MYYAILTEAGTVLDLECDPSEVDERTQALNGVLITQAETPELYKKRREQVTNGQFNWI
jgi:hypothetical protein